MDKKIISDRSIKIWESNTLAVAPINRILEPTSMKLFLWSMYQAVEQKQINNKGELEASFHLKDFGNYFNIRSKDYYSFAKKWLKKIQEYQYFYNNDINEEIIAQVAIPTASYHKGLMKIKFNSFFTENLLELKDNKIFIELKHLQKINNPRFIKLYEYLKAKVFVGQNNRVVNISVEDLYRLLVILENTYPYFGSFKYRILVPVIDEFNKIDDIKIEKWEVVKTGRKVTSIRFWVSNFSNKLLSKEEMTDQDLNKKIKCQKCWQGNW